MSKTVVNIYDVRTLEDLTRVLGHITQDAQLYGHHPSTVYPDKLRLALVEETLSDGSKVLNLCFSDGCERMADLLARRVEDQSSGFRQVTGYQPVGQLAPGKPPKGGSSAKRPAR